MKVHTDGVTSSAIASDGKVLLTGSHDGRVRVWDTSTFSCIQDIEPQHTHRQKWNEGILCLGYEEQMGPMCVTGGSDSNLMLYSVSC